MNQPRVVLFGVFDGLHDGHIFCIAEAQKLGTLTVVVAPDNIVSAMKNAAPEYNLAQRIHAIEQTFSDIRVVAGDEVSGAWSILATNPGIIAFGYDQHGLRETLEAYYETHREKPAFIILPDYRGHELHSSILRGNA